MKNRVDFSRIIATVFVTAIILSACNFPSDQNSTGAMGSNDIVSTPSPSEMLVELEVAREISPLGFFSYRPLKDYELGEDLDKVSLKNSDGSIFILIQGSEYQVRKDQLPEEIMNEFLDSMNEIMNGTLKVIGEIETRMIDSTQTYFNQVSGTTAGYKADGSTFLAILDESRIVFGMGLAMDDGAANIWQEEGKPAFYAFVSTFQFFSQETVARGCQVSQDPTYGYTQENPIKVGGSEMNGLPFDGISREYYYFLVLSGPNGETVEYQRTRSQETEDTILDEYIVSYEGIAEPKTIYVDIYHFEPPFAPANFSCYSYFPFEDMR